MHLMWRPWYLTMCKAISQISLGMKQGHQFSKNIAISFLTTYVVTGGCNQSALKLVW